MTNNLDIQDRILQGTIYLKNDADNLQKLVHSEQQNTERTKEFIHAEMIEISQKFQEMNKTAQEIVNILNKATGSE